MLFEALGRVLCGEAAGGVDVEALLDVFEGGGVPVGGLELWEQLLEGGEERLGAGFGDVLKTTALLALLRSACRVLSPSSMS